MPQQNWYPHLHGCQWYFCCVFSVVATLNCYCHAHGFHNAGKKFSYRNYVSVKCPTNSCGLTSSEILHSLNTKSDEIECADVHRPETRAHALVSSWELNDEINKWISLFALKLELPLTGSFVFRIYLTVARWKIRTGFVWMSLIIKHVAHTLPF